MTIEKAPERMWRETIPASKMYPDGGSFYHETEVKRSAVEYVRADVVDELVQTLEAIERGDDSIDGMVGDIARAAVARYRGGVTSAPARDS